VSAFEQLRSFCEARGWQVRSSHGSWACRQVWVTTDSDVELRKDFVEDDDEGAAAILALFDAPAETAGVGARSPEPPPGQYISIAANRAAAAPSDPASGDGLRDADWRLLKSRLVALARAPVGQTSMTAVRRLAEDALAAADRLCPTLEDGEQ
jgi:hypothetical protein